MKQFIEGSQAVAQVVKLCRPGVISAYPITPQTHIVEGLAKIVANGELKAEFVNVESEHSAASLVLGSVASGVRSFTATSSQGFLLMIEVLFNIAGMRLPLVMTCANRAISAPLSIWNDQQDSMTARDSGWIQLYAENNQEAADLHIQAYRISEDKDISLPVMVCMDGFILTHGAEVVDLPDQSEVDKFLPPFKLENKLDVEDPKTLGAFADPSYYTEARYGIQVANSNALEIIPKVSDEFKKIFGRATGGLVEGYKLEDAEQVIVAMGSIVGTIKETVDELRAEGKKVGVLKIITYRPFPVDAIYEALKDVREVAVLEKAVSMGYAGPLYADLKSAISCKSKINKISGFVIGLGGRDITKDSIRQVYSLLSGEEVRCEFIGLDPSFEGNG